MTVVEEMDESIQDGKNVILSLDFSRNVCYFLFMHGSDELVKNSN